MRLPGLRDVLLGALLSFAFIGSGDAASSGGEPRFAEPSALEATNDDAADDDAPAPNPATVPVPAGAPGPARVAEEIAAACSEKRYTDVGALLHPDLRRVWIDIGYNVMDFCKLLTRQDTLVRVRVDKEEQKGAYTVVFLTYFYRDGGEHPDRSTFLPFKGVWKLAG